MGGHDLNRVETVREDTNGLECGVLMIVGGNSTIWYLESPLFQRMPHGLSPSLILTKVNWMGVYVHWNMTSPPQNLSIQTLRYMYVHKITKDSERYGEITRKGL